MKVAYIANGYNNEVVKVTCRTEEEYRYWKRVMSMLEDHLSVDMSFGDLEWYDITVEEIADWDITEVER